MNQKQANRADRFTRKVTKVFHAEPVTFETGAEGAYGSVTVHAFGPEEKEPFASLFINSHGEGSLRAPGMAAQLRGKIRG